MIKKGKVQKFYKSTAVNFVTNALDEIELSMIFFVVLFFGVGCK